jgi:hypothetical protein
MVPEPKTTSTLPYPSIHILVWVSGSQIGIFKCVDFSVVSLHTGQNINKVEIYHNCKGVISHFHKIKKLKLSRYTP